MRGERRTPAEVLREWRMPRDERRAARAEREAEAQMRRERDDPHTLERIRARTAAGARELASALADAGYEVVAIDPASESPGVRPVALHELDEPAGSFDAAVAVVS